MEFTPEVIEQLGYYVYRLVDPRTGQTFYVGKGKGNRVFQHAKGDLKTEDRYIDEFGEIEDDYSLKLNVIRSIHREKLEVIHIIHRFGLKEREAFLVEAALIDCFPGLTNKQSGHDADKGTCNALTLQRRLSAPEFEDRDDLSYCMIKIREQTIDERGSIYEAVRKDWRVSLKRINKIPYVLACTNGVVLEVYKADGGWKPSPDVEGRYLFEGEVAPDEVRDYFCGKKLPEHYRRRGAASPVRYQKKKQNASQNKQ